VLAVATVILLAGCTTTTAGQATSVPGSAPETGSDTTTQSSEPGSDELPSHGAPKVTDPLDTTKFQENPCLSLTSEQSDSVFELSPSGEPYESELGKACKWRNDSTRGEVDVVFLDKDPRGLSAEYEVNEDGRWAYFEELTLEGYPAVARSQVDRRDGGACTIVVGASDEIAFEVPVQLSTANIGNRDACAVAEDVTKEVIKTMKAG
jgi:hypothetical protein